MGSVLLGSLAGCLLGSVISCLPALHVYNVAGFFVLFLIALPEWAAALSAEFLGAFFMGLVVAYAILNTIPSIFWGAPDESAVWVTLPGQKYLMQGRGREAALLTGVGALGGLLFLLLVAPFAGTLLAPVRRVVGPHMHWVLASIVAFLVMTEWPKWGDRGPTALWRLWYAWKPLLAGILTMALSALLGMILFYRPVISHEVAFQNLMPAFVGLFAIPWVLTNLINRTEVPRQFLGKTLDLGPVLALRGVGAGVLGGLFAALFPIVTGGVGGLLAGQGTAQNDDRMFILSQGASKVVYYVGAFLFFFAPGLSISKGGLAWMAQSVYQPLGAADYLVGLSSMCLSGAVALGLLYLLSGWAARLVERVNYRWISAAVLVVIVAVVLAMTGLAGFAVALVATGIGLVPVLAQSRRLNCLGILLVPMSLNMGGLGPDVAEWLGLLG